MNFRNFLMSDRATASNRICLKHSSSLAKGKSFIFLSGKFLLKQCRYTDCSLCGDTRQCLDRYSRGVIAASWWTSIGSSNLQVREDISSRSSSHGSWLRWFALMSSLIRLMALSKMNFLTTCQELDCVSIRLWEIFVSLDVEVVNAVLVSETAIVDSFLEECLLE